MKIEKKDKKNWIINLILIVGTIGIVSIACLIILDKLSPSEEYIDCLNCNPDVLSQFNHPIFFVVLIFCFVVVSLALIFTIPKFIRQGEKQT